MTNPTTPTPPPGPGDIIPPEAIGAPDKWCIFRSDNAGAIQIFQTELRSFIHAETGAHHTHAETWGADPHDAAAAPIRFYPVHVANSRPDSRWFENVAAVYELDEAVPEVVVRWSGDLKELTEAVRDETRARVWGDADRRLAPYDSLIQREQEFGAVPDQAVHDYRADVRAASSTADQEIEGARDMAALGRAESNYETTVNGLDAPDRNPFHR